MSKRNAGGMPSGRNKRGGLGGAKKEKIEVGLHPDEKAWIEEAAAMRRMTLSRYCAEHSVTAARKDIADKHRS